MGAERQKLCVLGATGSIGLNTLDVASRHVDLYEIYAITAHSDWRSLLELCKKYRPRYAVLSSSQARIEAGNAFDDDALGVEVLFGSESLVDVASMPDVDVVMASIVGAAGLAPNLAAAQAGKKVLLANKESLVLAGKLFMDAVKASGAVLLPIDSEHNAIFQCLPSNYACGAAPNRNVTKLLLTASGGPFRTYTRSELECATPEQACAHPNWSMGRKISVDSASLMNKGLELIEACWLFDVSPSQIEVVVHPQSIVHSMVRYCDGSVLAQMGQPDMRTPIAYGLAWPERIDAGVQDLDFAAMADLSFEKPKEALFPCLSLAREAFEHGGEAPAYLNAANEVAVDAFLNGKVRFVDIPDIIRNVMSCASSTTPTSLETILNADEAARTIARDFIKTSVKQLQTESI